MTDENKFGEEAEKAQWIGVDLDGTLAEAEPWKGFDHIGKPVPMMMKRLKNMAGYGLPGKDCNCPSSKSGARDSSNPRLVKKNGLPELEITSHDDMDMREYDDRCVQVVQIRVVRRT